MRFARGLAQSLDRTPGEQIDGPGESNLSWTLEVLDQGVIEPPRRVLRLYAKASYTTEGSWDFLPTASDSSRRLPMSSWQRSGLR